MARRARFLAPYGAAIILSAGALLFHGMFATPWISAGGLVAAGILGSVLIGHRRAAAHRLANVEAELAETRAELLAVRTALAARSHAEQEVRRLNETLEERVRVRTADLESFSHTVAHDLRAPLRAMRGFAEALEEDYGDRLDDTARQYTRRIVCAASQMDQLITDLLQYSRLTHVETPVQPVPVGPVLQETLALFAEDVARVGATLEAPPTDAVVLGHRTTLSLVLQNLVSNALKFHQPGVAPWVRVTVAPRGKSCRIAVTDRGIGVAAEHRTRIFDVFERLHSDDRYPGTGIGLAIVRRAVQRMNGEVGVDSELGHGSTFWVELSMEPTYEPDESHPDR